MVLARVTPVFNGVDEDVGINEGQVHGEVTGQGSGLAVVQLVAGPGYFADSTGAFLEEAFESCHRFGSFLGLRGDIFEIFANHGVDGGVLVQRELAGGQQEIFVDGQG